MLFPTPTLTPSDQAVLAEIDGMRRRLRHQIQAHPGGWTFGLRKFLTADAVAAPRFPAAALELARTPFTLVSPYPNESG